jgi:hypothetical protein
VTRRTPARTFDERFPLATRVGEAAAERYGGAYEADLGFTLGLPRLLDGARR